MNEFYLHPVLSCSGDAILPRLDANNSSIEIKQTTNSDYLVSVALRLNNEYIENLITEEQAEYFVVIDCPNTMYRRSYHKHESHNDIAIPRTSVYGTVSVKPYVLVRENIQYCNPCANEDYDGMSFQLNKGDVLVEFQGYKFDAELTYTMESIFKVVPHSQQDEKLVKYDLEDKIRIKLPMHDYDFYKSHKGMTEFDSTFHSSLVMNALLYALFVGDFDKAEKDNDPIWKKSIRDAVNNDKRLKNIPISDKTRYNEIAQILLDNPISKLFEDLNNE